MARRFHQSLAGLLRIAYLRLHRATNRNFSPLDATADQYVLMRLLRDRDGLTQQELTSLSASDPTTIGSMVKLMEKRGWVERRPDPNDGRAKQVFLTDDVRAKCQQLFVSARWIRTRLEGVVDESEMPIVLKALNAIADAFEAEAECLQGERKWSPAKRSARSETSA